MGAPLSPSLLSCKGTQDKEAGMEPVFLPPVTPRGVQKGGDKIGFNQAAAASQILSCPGHPHHSKRQGRDPGEKGQGSQARKVARGAREGQCLGRGLVHLQMHLGHDIYPVLKTALFPSTKPQLAGCHTAATQGVQPRH